MATSKNKKFSTLVQAATELDADFTQLEQLATHIGQVSVNSESEVSYSRKLFQRFSEASQRIGTGVTALAQALDESRGRAEKAMISVEARANEVQLRERNTEAMYAKFQSLGTLVGEISTAIAELPQPQGKEGLSKKDALVRKQLPELNKRLAELIQQTKDLKNEAKIIKLPALEKNADSLSQRLESVHKKLSAFLD